MADQEFAPTGTKALLADVAKYLRESEAAIVRNLKAVQDEIAEAVGGGVEVSYGRTRATPLTERLAGVQRLVGRVDTALAAWDLSELTLDDADALFVHDPSAHNGDRLVAIAERSREEGLITDAALATFRAKVEEAREPL